MLTVMSELQNTFIEIVRILTDAKFVQEMLPKVQDPMVQRLLDRSLPKLRFS